MPCKLCVELKHHTRKQVLESLIRVCLMLGITPEEYKKFSEFGSYERVDYEFCGDASDWNIESGFVLIPVKLIECDYYLKKQETYKFDEYPDYIIRALNIDLNELSDDVKIILNSKIEKTHYE